MSASPVITEQSCLHRADDVPWKTIDGAVMLLDLASGDFFELDEVGSWIWERLDGQRSVERLAEHLTAEFDVPIDVARSDVIVFLTDLHGKGLVRAR